ncbi:MAG: glycosyltransferase family 4 protein [Actinomycetales bacterium]|nr:glycosyltransferase family 4 protein [Actinomycetales bacterium]
MICADKGTVAEVSFFACGKVATATGAERGDAEDRESGVGMTDGRAIARRNVLIITGDPIGAKLAGPAIRAWNMALLLSETHNVRLVTFTGAEHITAPFEVLFVAAGDDVSFNPLEEWADVIVFQGHAMLVFERLQSTRKIMVVDIYDPMHLEQLEQARELPREQWIQQVAEATEVLNDQLTRGDFFLCASERQRLFWLGQLAGQGRLNPLTYENDPDLTGLIDVAPFGLSRVQPEHARQVLKGVHPGIAVDDKVLLWSGGLYNWFDPQTLIRAVGVLAGTHPDIRLFFQGTKHPHPGVPEMEIVSQSRRLASELGLLDVTVFFNASWVDFDDRQNYLLEADIGVSTHHSHIETTFSFRTRILDYLWAELPMVVTEGDHFADLIRRENLGIAVPADDVAALAAALEKVLFDENFRALAKENIRRVRQAYFWDIALKPLSDFVGVARHAADNGYVALGQSRPMRTPRKRRPTTGFRHDIHLAVVTFKKEGLRSVLAKFAKRLT